MQPSRLLGVLEVAGSFQINITVNEKYASGHSVGIGFILVSKEEDLLTDIVKTLQGLTIKSKVKGNKLIINGLQNILVFNKFITDYNGFTSESRKFQFKQWERIVECMDCEEHHFIDGVNQIKKIKNKMKGGNNET